MAGHYYFLIVLLILLAVYILYRIIGNNIITSLNAAHLNNFIPFQIILVIISAGLFCGAYFSNGMMDVSQKIILNPHLLSVENWIIVLFTVLLSEIILYNFFYKLGIQNSVTISVLFELFGALAGISLINKFTTGNELQLVVNYLNGAFITKILLWILVSITLAFILGYLANRLTKFLITIKNPGLYFASLAGLLITVFFYFFFIRGISTSSPGSSIFKSISLNEWIDLLSKKDYAFFKSFLISLQNNTLPIELKSWSTVLNTYNQSNYHEGISKFITWSHSVQKETWSIPITYAQFVLCYSWQIVVVFFLIVTITMQALIEIFKVNLPTFLVIFGIFALSVSFAGNELAFFTGIPFTAFSGLHEFISNSGLGSTIPMIGSTNYYTESKSLMLLIAGLIVIISLWIVKRSKLIEPDKEGVLFESKLSQLIEKNQFAINFNRQFTAFTGRLKKMASTNSISNNIQDKTSNETLFRKKKNKDNSALLLRTAWNLNIASILVAIGISMSIPFATTYLVCMTALGTSLTEETKEKKTFLAGFIELITSIGVWLAKAIVTFAFTFLLVLIIHKTLWIGLILILLIVCFIFLRKQMLLKIKSNSNKNSALHDSFLTIEGNMVDTYSQNIVSMFIAAHNSYEKVLNGLSKLKRKDLKEAKIMAGNQNEEIKKLKKQIPQLFKDLNEEAFESGRNYLAILEFLQSAMHCLNHIATTSYKHIDNNNKPLTDFQIRSLKDIFGKLSEAQIKIIMGISESNYSNSNLVFKESRLIIELIEDYKTEQLKLFRTEPEKTKTNVFYLDLLNEAKKYVIFLKSVYESLSVPIDKRLAD